MIVKYSRERGYQGEGDDPHLTLEKSYLVLTIDLNEQGEAGEVVVLSDSSMSPGVYDLNSFDTIDPAIPPDWQLRPLGNSLYRLEPIEFGGDFWDRFHGDDEDPKAQLEFARVYEKLKSFHRWEQLAERNRKPTAQQLVKKWMVDSKCV